MSGSGGRSTGTVPKTKHNYRTRRESQVNHVNHIPNNLDWQPDFGQSRGRKESNTFASLPDPGDDFMGDGSPWPTNRTDDDELRWSNVKTSNIMPERGAAEAMRGRPPPKKELTNIEDRIQAMHELAIFSHNPSPKEGGNPMGDKRAHSGHEFVHANLDDRGIQAMQEYILSEEREMNGETPSVNSRSRAKLKASLGQSQRKMEELQQQQAALLNLRKKAVQQVKSVQACHQMEEIQVPILMRNKAVQQVKPVQIEMEKMAANLGDRLQAMQEYAHIIQAFERDEASGPSDCDSDQIRNKLSELLSKKTQCENILAYIEPEPIEDGPGSASSEGGESQCSARYHAGANGGETEMDLHSGKQDNRELIDQISLSSVLTSTRELKLDEVRNKLEQLQSLLNRVERLRDGKPQPRVNGESHVEPIQVKNRPPASIMEKLHTKKIDLEQTMQKKGFSQGAVYQPYHQPEQSWANGSTNSIGGSSEEAEVEYECPVKLCSPPTTSNSFPNKPRGSNVHQNIVGAGQSKAPSDRRLVEDPRYVCLPQPSEEMSPNNSTLAFQINQLQMRMEEMQLLYQSVLDKQTPSFSGGPLQPMTPLGPQSWHHLLNQPQMGFVPMMGHGGPQWQQHQLLINSLNQCCQLIWHQQRELAALRQALAMLQEESTMYKCGGYGNNLNFGEPGLLWTHQTSPQTLNNQVPPGNRANNYWDNFRSYSRQNLLSGRNKSNEGSIADSLPSSQVMHARVPTAQTDNLRRKDNSSSPNPSSKLPHMSQPVLHDGSSGLRQRRFHSSPNKVDHSAFFSLEQSVYSELETVISEAERSPQLLLQLLTHLKSLRSQHPNPFEETELETAEICPASLKHLQREPPRTPSHFGGKSCLWDVYRMVAQAQAQGRDEECSADLLQNIVHVLRRDCFLGSEPAVRLEASLLKFQGARLSQISKELLDVIEFFINGPLDPPPHSFVPKMPLNSGRSDQDEEEEEGAVGGVPLDFNQSADTELAEADQPQHESTDTTEDTEHEEAHGKPELDNDKEEPEPNPQR